jgi:phage shock protein C
MKRYNPANDKSHTNYNIIMAQKKLYLSHDKQLCGVCGGIAEYLDLDPTLVRVGYVLLSLCFTGFPGLLIYFILYAIIPQKPFR